MPDPGISLLVALSLMGFSAALFWPERGLWPRWQEARRLTARVRREDALKHVYKYEMDGLRATAVTTAGILNIRRGEAAELLTQMQADHLIELENGTIGLTPSGRETALHIVRAHRLWERHLADETGFGEESWHRRAEQAEHLLSPTDVALLSERLGNPTHDPHGDPIPTEEGMLDSRQVTHQGQPLTSLTRGAPAYIVHLEDEPAMLYAQLVAEGLHPGMAVRIMDSTPQQVRFWSNVGEHVLAPIVAANIAVAPLPAEVAETTAPIQTRHLDDLAMGESAKVLSLSPGCRGSERRRFMDLGILPGVQITAELQGASGDPRAYRIRDALIALRHDQAALINVAEAEA